MMILEADDGRIFNLSDETDIKTLISRRYAIQYEKQYIINDNNKYRPFINHGIFFGMIFIIIEVEAMNN